MRNTRGDLFVCLSATSVMRREDGRTEVSRGHSSFCAGEAKARTWKSGEGTDTLTDETDADRKAEMPEDSRKGRGGTSPGTGRERQASAAAEETSRPETTMLMEEVLRRENLVKAYHRVRRTRERRESTG